MKGGKHRRTYWENNAITNDSPEHYYNAMKIYRKGAFRFMIRLCMKKNSIFLMLAIWETCTCSPMRRKSPKFVHSSTFGILRLFNRGWLYKPKQNSMVTKSMPLQQIVVAEVANGLGMVWCNQPYVGKESQNSVKAGK